MANNKEFAVPDEFTRSKNVDSSGVPRPVADSQKFSYGTAGFRMRGELLTFVAFRCGYLAGLRAKLLGKTVGLMITASHNPEEDNGVKMVDPMGEMLAIEWEAHASAFINAHDDAFADVAKELMQKASIKNGLGGVKLLCARDTRPSGKRLLTAAQAGAALAGVSLVDLGELTTPQLHYAVRVANDPDFGPEAEIGYCSRFGDAFDELAALTPLHGSFQPGIHLDCANGVGASKFRVLEGFLPDGAINASYYNETGILNHEVCLSGAREMRLKCGADFVKIGRRLPAGMERVPVGARCASFDGDADRLIYFYRPEGAKDTREIRLLDGDKIALLLAKYIQEQLKASKLDDQLSVGIVQTAYANGNSTKYIREKLGLTVEYVPTGVKHLHHAALAYDIGVYFEANGHGTVVFSHKFDSLVRKALEAQEENVALKKLALYSRLINEVVGDAMADLLAVELALRHFGWSIEDWDALLYEDCPSVQIKIPVKDRSRYKTTWAETELVEPEGLQYKIDALVQQRGHGARAFVRPSGTENIVRVYAEATTADDAEQLGREIEILVKTF